MKTTSEVERSSEARRMRYSRVRCRTSPVVPFPVIILIISVRGGKLRVSIKGVEEKKAGREVELEGSRIGGK
jgi:hypothetical protein